MTYKNAFGDLGKVYSQEVRLQMVRELNARDTLIGEAIATEGVATRVIAVVKVLFRYLFSGFTLAIRDYNNHVSLKDVDRMIEEKRDEVKAKFKKRVFQVVFVASVALTGYGLVKYYPTLLGYIPVFTVSENKGIGTSPGDIEAVLKTPEAEVVPVPTVEASKEAVKVTKPDLAAPQDSEVTEQKLPVDQEPLKPEVSAYSRVVIKK